jgi:aspartokinase-like uncharacterized kinase
MSSIAKKGIMEPDKSDPSTTPRPDSRDEPTTKRGDSLLVVKVGGSLLAEPGALNRVAGALVQVARRRATVVIPGGGPFAEAVRAFDQAHGLSPGSAHWMAILAMDQYAYALAERITNSRVVEGRPGILSALGESTVPVLAPYRWLRAADELPHSWEVTSDSLAAYLAMLLGAAELVLVKSLAGGEELVDPYFRRALAAGMRWRVVSAAADELDTAISQ